ncbi:MAG: hypothetical protein LBM77_01200 [Spirochaetaceae bacterium]|jgi:hypothetical protein|nr:hypothetical protein [Spirochaetaceae bacterium]
MKNKIESQHINEMHRMGRIYGVLALLIMIGVPVIAGLYFDAMPGFFQILAASVGLLAIFIPVTVSETIAYTPVFGSSIYLTMVTGNISNLKLPVANEVLKVIDVQPGTEDADVVTNIAVAISSLVTLTILILGVILMLPLRPILELPTVKLAAGYILPALFGVLGVGVLQPNLGGGITTKGRMKGMILPCILILFINILFVYIIRQPIIVSTFQGFIILLMLPVAWFSTKSLYKKGKVQVFLPGEN